MKTTIKYIVIIALALLASWIAGTITFEIIEFITPSKRYDTDGHPNFIMPTSALFCSLIIAIIIFISLTVWMHWYSKKNSK